MCTTGVACGCMHIAGGSCLAIPYASGKAHAPNVRPELARFPPQLLFPFRRPFLVVVDLLSVVALVACLVLTVTSWFCVCSVTCALT